MRLDADSLGFVPHDVYHAEECRSIGHLVTWVDDETNEYWRADEPLRAEHDAVAGRVYQARKIDILQSMRLIIINPVEDYESEPVKAIARVPVRIE